MKQFVIDYFGISDIIWGGRCAVITRRSSIVSQRVVETLISIIDMLRQGLIYKSTHKSMLLSNGTPMLSSSRCFEIAPTTMTYREINKGMPVFSSQRIHRVQTKILYKNSMLITSHG